MTPADPPILELDDLRKSFGATAAVAGVSGAFARGEYVCVLGPSGCGKTTLLRMIAGFEEPTGGDLRLDGRSLLDVPPDQRDVNVVFQSYALFPHLSVRDNVAFGPRMKKLPRTEVDVRTAEALTLVRMDELADRSPRQLSGGQQQRVALARALVNRPQVLLLDEPLSALDRSLRMAMQEELRAVQRRTGVTFIHITHDQGEALSLADRLIVMRGGRFEQIGPPGEVYDRPRTRFVADFLGSANVLEATLGADGTVRTAEGIACAAPAGTALPPGRVLLALRPEAIHVVPGGAGGPEGLGCRIAGRIAQLSTAGPVVECRVDVGGRELIAHLRRRAGARLAVGREVLLEIPADAVVLLPVEDA